MCYEIENKPSLNLDQNTFQTLLLPELTIKNPSGMNTEISKDDILKALTHIDENPGLVKKRNSTTYDLVFKGKKYPPILALSVANELNGGKELKLSDFGNNTDKPFEILRANGFSVEEKSTEVSIDLNEFIEVANEQTTGQGTTNSAKQYINANKGTSSDLKIIISFGIGRASAIPWIAFTGYSQSVKDGVYPVYLYYKNSGILILAFGISETEEPTINWDIPDSTQTIKEYFQNTYSKNPERYGGSFIHAIYDVNALPKQSVLDSDLDSIIRVYKNQLEGKDVSKKSYKSIRQKEFSLAQFQADLNNSGLVFSEMLIKRFVASLLTKPFVILTGLSGSGKTKLAQAFVKWICQDTSQYLVVPVGADWTNREPLLGYPNALEPGKYVKPDSGALDLILRAKENPASPYFLVLDEMNLSHVERYFADFLSAMESKEEIPLYSGEKVSGIPDKLRMPDNLFIIGTVNIDETTNMFSPKVLDRANTIEFRVTESEMNVFLTSLKKVDIENLIAKGSNMAHSFLLMTENKSFSMKDLEEINETLLKFFGELKKTGAEFGYRSATEILQLIYRLSILDPDLEIKEKVDIAIMQKLLPKLHGSRRKLSKRLEVLGSFCVSDGEKIIAEVFEKPAFDFNGSNVRYPLSLEKISRMYNGAVENGFTSFAEA
ncbi:MAG: 5-methylcytosine-specific restriction protein B [Marinoscillum sp.]